MPTSAADAVAEEPVSGLSVPLVKAILDARQAPQQAAPAPCTSLTSPCGASPVEALHLHGNALWVGCNLGAGLWTSSDAGDSFSRGHPSTDLFVFDLASTRGGELLMCGADFDLAFDGVLVRRFDGTGWEDLLERGNNTESANQVNFSNCGQIAEHPNGGLFASSLTAPDITYSSNNGASWVPETRLFEEANLRGTRAVFQLIRVTSTSSGIFASGYNIIQPPTFFAPSEAEGASWFNLKAKTVDAAIQGEGWSLATPDNGATWYVGGRDQELSREASGFIYRSLDGGGSWTSLPLGPEIDIVRDIAFSEDGHYGIAVGDRYPPRSLGGFALLTRDGGRSWEALDEDLPPDLRRAAVDGTTYFFGGNGSLYRGGF
jgi:photosystem II stability/assembly factor-like uncharacterized protein